MSEETKITTVSDLIAEVGRLQDHYGVLNLWFRGQRQTTWDLVPSVFRDGHESQERNYTHRFRSRAKTRYAGAPAYGDFALWLSLMQHYALPTRLLDWSRSPLVAAYFAIEAYLYGDAAEVDAAIWVLQPHGLNGFEIGSDVTPGIEAGMIQNFIDPAFLEESEEPNGIVAAMASEHDLRMFVQQGCFTIHSDRTALNKRERSERWLTKLVITADAIRSFSNELQICGLRKGDIYPDLEHLAHELKVLKGI